MLYVYFIIININYNIRVMLAKLIVNIQKKQVLTLEKTSTLLEILFFMAIIYCIWQFPYCYRIFGTALTLLCCNLFFYFLKKITKKSK